VEVVEREDVGRRAELGELAALLAEHRLLTLSGAGGCGKTRLACEVLGAGEWPDGVRWVDLGAVSDPARVPDVVAAAVGALVDPARGPLVALRGELADRRLCLGLDNCEHLLDICARLVEDLLSTCPGLTVLATSREPLGVPGETVWRVPSLAVAEAVELFADRARHARPDYADDPDDTGSGLWISRLDEISRAQNGINGATGDPAEALCRRLDGIPLAIELAAAWIRVLTPVQIANALDDRFDLLVGVGRTLLPRQQTLAASVAWSYDLLGDDARVLLQRLGVFAGGCTLEAARAVCAGGQPPTSRWCSRPTRWSTATGSPRRSLWPGRSTSDRGRAGRGAAAPWPPRGGGGPRGAGRRAGGADVGAARPLRGP
jgi:predicted ATPase